MPFTPEAGERAMRVHEVILRGLSGELTWLQVADILGRAVPEAFAGCAGASSISATMACTTGAASNPPPSGPR
jgi:hypothetical protein